MPGLVLKENETTWTAPVASGSKDFPGHLTGPLVWSGKDFQHGRKMHILSFSQQDVEELEKALVAFQNSSLDDKALDRSTFCISEDLSSRIQAIGSSIYDGSGFAVARGLNPAKYSEHDNLLLFAGISSHVADQRQDMQHIRCRPARDADDKLRPPDLTVSMNFHTDCDGGDITALYTLEVAGSGGTQHLASIWKVYNELTKTNPGCIQTLTKNWRFEIPWRNGIEVVNRPLLYYHTQKMLVTFTSSFLKASAYDDRLPDCPPLTLEQGIAMAAVLQSCHEHAVAYKSERGDMLFFNNLALLHQRDAFTNDLASGHVRHLASLMLRDTKRTWAQPEALKVFADARFSLAQARMLPLFGEHRKSGPRPDPYGPRPEPRPGPHPEPPPPRHD